MTTRPVNSAANANQVEAEFDIGSFQTPEFIAAAIAHTTTYWPVGKSWANKFLLWTVDMSFVGDASHLVRSMKQEYWSDARDFADTVDVHATNDQKETVLATMAHIECYAIGPVAARLLQRGALLSEVPERNRVALVGNLLAAMQAYDNLPLAQELCRRGLMAGALEISRMHPFSGAVSYYLQAAENRELILSLAQAPVTMVSPQ